MQKITLNDQNYLIVETPKGYTCKLSMYNDHLRCMENTIGNSSSMDYIDLPKINEDEEYELVGKIVDILKNEDICRKLVENSLNCFSYKNYLSKNQPTGIPPKDSFLSYLQSIELDLTKEYLLIQKL